MGEDEDLAKSVEDLVGPLQKLSTLLEKIAGSSATFSQNMTQAGTALNNNNAGAQGTGQKQLGVGSPNFLSKGLAGFSFGIKTLTNVAATSVAMMPDLNQTIGRAAGYYGATMMGAGGMSVGWRNLSAATLSGMRSMGGLSSVGEDAAVAATLGGQYVQASTQRGSLFQTLARSAAGVSSIMPGINNQQAAQAMGGLGTGAMSANLMQKYGIWTTDPMTGKEKSPSSILGEVSNFLTGGAKLSSAEIAKQVRGGFLGQSIQNSGLDAAQQAILVQGMMNEAQTGKKTDWSNPATMAALKKQLGAKGNDNPLAAQQNIYGIQTNTMQTAQDAYVKGMQDAVPAITKLEGVAGDLAQKFGRLAAMTETILSDRAGGALAAGLAKFGSDLSSFFTGLGLGGGLGGGGGSLIGKGLKGIWNAATKAGTEVASEAGAMAGFGAALTPLASVSATKAMAYYGPQGSANATADIKRAQAEYGKYYSSTEFLLATGNKPSTGWSGTTSSLGGTGSSGMGNMGGDGSTIGAGSVSATNGVFKLILPVGKCKVTTRYGQTDKVHKNPHYAIDWACPIGTKIQAAAAGTVVHASGTSANTFKQGGNSGGMMVIIKHDGGYFTEYMHMSAFFVKEGDTVAQGQPIGLSGNSGRSTGPHLHFGLKKGSSPVDPSPFLGESMTWTGADPTASNQSSMESGDTTYDASSSDLSSGYNAGVGSTGFNIPSPIGANSIAGGAAAASGAGQTLMLGHGGSGAQVSNTSTGGGQGGPDSGPTKISGGGNNVTINLSIADASPEQARSFARMVKNYLEDSSVITNMGRL